MRKNAGNGQRCQLKSKAMGSLLTILMNNLNDSLTKVAQIKPSQSAFDFIKTLLL
jgi:hypothetical protein